LGKPHAGRLFACKDSYFAWQTEFWYLKLEVGGIYVVNFKNKIEIIFSNDADH